MAVLAHLSPRRRALVAAAGLLVLVLLAAGAAAAVVRAGGPASGGYPAQDQPGPVLLVPGYGGGTGALNRLAGRIRATGRQATVIRPPGDATGDLREQARVLDTYVARALAGGAPSVDIVGFSAGGVVARIWVRDHDGTHRARRVITLASPHHGTELAALGTAVVPGLCGGACEQLVPGSSLLASLDRDRTGAHPRWLSVWTTEDQTVTPPDTARLAGAVNVALQSVCPDAHVSHGDLPADPLASAIVLRALGTAPLSAPGPADCAALRRGPSS